MPSEGGFQQGRGEREECEVNMTRINYTNVYNSQTKNIQDFKKVTLEKQTD